MSAVLLWLVLSKVQTVALVYSIAFAVMVVSSLLNSAMAVDFLTQDFKYQDLESSRRNLQQALGGELLWQRLNRFVKRYLWTLFIAVPLCLLPSIEDIWRVRIALVKLELASPENVRTASETIERIGKKLECKYLGCEGK